MRQNMKISLAVAIGVIGLALLQHCSSGPPPPVPPPADSYRIVRTYPHDPDAYTQGLTFADGRLIEGTGRDSSVRIVELQTGKILKRHDLDPKYFGEGLTVWKGRIIQLTWTARVGFVYDLTSLVGLKRFRIPTEEGWGLTHDGTRLILSDGTARLTFLNPDTFESIGSVEVRDDRGPIEKLNELEFVNGEVWANVWESDRIVRIDPASGRVTGWIDLTGLFPPEERSEPMAVLNGIAYDAAADRLFVTGKLWPHLFEIKVTPSH